MLWKYTIWSRNIWKGIWNKFWISEQKENFPLLVVEIPGLPSKSMFLVAICYNQCLVWASEGQNIAMFFVSAILWTNLRPNCAHFYFSAQYRAFFEEILWPVALHIEQKALIWDSCDVSTTKSGNFTHQHPDSDEKIIIVFLFGQIILILFSDDQMWIFILYDAL